MKNLLINPNPYEPGHRKTILQIVLHTALIILLTALIPCAAYSADLPVYNPPPGAKAEEAFYTRPELTRGISLGFIDNINGITPKKKEIQKELRIIPLAPKHTGLTTVSQPNLQWYINRGWSQRTIIFSLDEYGSAKTKPVVKFEIGGPSEAGIYQINFSHRKITLEPDKKYEWFLAVEHKGQLITTGSKIEYKRPNQSLISKLERTQVRRLMFEYASNGYWYDAISEAQNQLNRKPGDPVLTAQRDSLLSQIGLKLEP